MASVSLGEVQKLISAATDTALGQKLANAVVDSGNRGGWTIAGLIVATNVSTTVDFGSLKVGDKVVTIPAAAGNSIFYTVATAGTLPAAAVVGSLYVVIRAVPVSNVTQTY